MVDAGIDETNIWYVGPGNARPSGKIKPLDGDLNLIEIDYNKTEPKWFHRLPHPLSFGVPVKTQHVMSRFRWYASTTFDFLRWSSYLIVSRKFKNVVDDLEPNTHQFLPVDFVGARGALIDRMYVFVPNVALRCFSPMSLGYVPLGWENHWGDHIWHVQGSCRNPRRIFEDEVVRGHHLWVAVDCWDLPVMVSNELRKAFCSAGLTNLSLRPAESREKLRWMLPEVVKSRFAVDPPWVAWLAEPSN